MTKLTQAAKDQPCIRCGSTGTTRFCHLNGFRAHSFGKGRGIKGHDLIGCDFCEGCDRLFSEEYYHVWEGGSKSLERSEEFMFWCLKTILRRYEQGVMK